MLRTGPILIPTPAYYGHRISVMSRHTLNDGRTPHPNIKRGSYEEHWPALGPDPKLIGDYYHRGLAWPGFEQRYLERLRTDPGARERFAALLALLRDGSDLLLLCIEEGSHFCHRRLLAEECRRRMPGLCVIIK